MPVIVWEPNRTSTLQHLVEISNRLCFGTMQVFEEVPAKVLHAGMPMRSAM